MIFATLISTFRDILQQRKIRNPTRSLKTANNNQSVYSHGGSAGAALLQCAVFPAAAAESGRWWQVAEVQAPPPQFVDPGQAQRQREAQAGLDIDGAVLRTLQHELEEQLCMSLSLPFITITVFLYRKKLDSIMHFLPLSLDKVQYRQIMVVSSIQLNLQKLQKK